MTIDNESKKWLTKSQIEYWKDPEKKRAQQRAKYARYPKKIYSMNRAWQIKNRDHFNKLVSFCQKIKKARNAKDFSLVQILVKAKEEYKKAWKTAKASSSQTTQSN